MRCRGPVERILPFHGQPRVGDATYLALFRVDRLHDHGHQTGHHVRELPVAQSAERGRRDFDTEIEVVRLHADRRKADNILGPRMGTGRVDERVLGLRLVHVDLQVDLFATHDHLNAVGDAFAESPVQPARVGAVQIANLVARQLLTRRILNEHFWVRPMLRGISGSRTMSVHPGLSVRAIDGDELSVGLLRVVVGERAVVRLGYHHELALADLCVLDHDHAAHPSAGLVGVVT